MTLISQRKMGSPVQVLVQTLNKLYKLLNLFGKSGCNVLQVPLNPVPQPIHPHPCEDGHQIPWLLIVCKSKPEPDEHKHLAVPKIFGTPSHTAWRSKTQQALFSKAVLLFRHPKLPLESSLRCPECCHASPKRMVPALRICLNTRPHPSD